MNSRRKLVLLILTYLILLTCHVNYFYMKTHSFDSLMKYLNWGAGKNSKNSDDVYAENGWIKDSGVKKWGFFPENETSVDVEAVLGNKF